MWPFSSEILNALIPSTSKSTKDDVATNTVVTVSAVASPGLPNGNPAPAKLTEAENSVSPPKIPKSAADPVA